MDPFELDSMRDNGMTSADLLLCVYVPVSLSVRVFARCVCVCVLPFCPSLCVECCFVSAARAQRVALRCMAALACHDHRFGGQIGHGGGATADAVAQRHALARGRLSHCAADPLSLPATIGENDNGSSLSLIDQFTDGDRF